MAKINRIVVLIFLTIACSPVRQAGITTKESSGEEIKKVNANTRWEYKDMVKDSVPGIGLYRAIPTIKNENSSPIIIAVIDSGIDYNHPEIKDWMWINSPEELPNGIDNDHNGFVDDVHGWNFLSGKNGDMAFTQLEITRLVKQLGTDSLNETEARMKFQFDSAREVVASKYNQLISRLDEPDESQQQWIHELENANRYLYNTDINPRNIIGDNLNELFDTTYGNYNIAPRHSREVHGTHVTGIIVNLLKTAEVSNQTVRIMALRAIPEGDEYDKDVARAIYYAVDNGAKVINMSFGKDYSSHPDWVKDAMQYASEKDVLLVMAAGNSSMDLDKKRIFPKDTHQDSEVVENMVVVGACTKYLNELIIAPFSNYGNQNVDVFAPGMDIYSTLPHNQYGIKNGTSMAAPFVSATAALIRNLYTDLSAAQIKQILIASASTYDGQAIIPGSMGKIKPFAQFSVSGGVLNVVAALELAAQKNKPIKE